MDDTSKTGQNQRSPVQSSASTGSSVFWQAMGFAWDFGIVVVVPLVALGLLGRFLDKKLGTQPWLLLGALILSIILSTTLLVVRLNAIVKKITKK